MSKQTVTTSMALAYGIPKRSLPGKPACEVIFEANSSNNMFGVWYNRLSDMISVGKSLYVFGTPNSGKSEVCSILAKKALHLGHSIAYTRAYDFLDAKSIEVPAPYESLSDWLKQAHLLVIEDIDTLRFFPDILVPILEHRWNNLKTIIFTISMGINLNTTDDFRLIYMQYLEETLLKSEKGLGCRWPVRISQSFDKLFTGYRPYESREKQSIETDEG